MEVSSVYFRRLLQANASAIFPNALRQNDSAQSTYPLLASEMQKLTRSPQQAWKIADALDTTDGDLFRDFDLSTFMEHFRLDPVAKITLALACRTASKQDIRTKGILTFTRVLTYHSLHTWIQQLTHVLTIADAILTSNYNNFIDVLANPSASTEDLQPTLVAFILARLIQDPPRQWNEEKQHTLLYTIESRYSKLRIPIPNEVSATVVLMNLLQPTNTLVRAMQRAGPSATRDLDACRNALAFALSSAEDPSSALSYQQVANALLYLVIAQEEEPYDVSLFVAALRQHRDAQRLDWTHVVKALDRPTMRITKTQFLAFYNALLPIAKETDNFDIQSLWGNDWEYADTQLSYVVAFLSCTPAELDAAQIPRLRAAFTEHDFADATDDVKEYAKKALSHPMISLDATKALFTSIFSSQDAYNHAQTLGIPETVINANTDIFVVAASAVEKPWAPLQEMALNQLFRPFFHKTLPHYDFVLHALWKHDRAWLAARLVQTYETDSTLLPLISGHAQEHGWLDTLIMIPNQFGLDLAAHAHGEGVMELDQWAQTHLQSAPQQLAAAIANFLRYKAEDEAIVQRGQPPSTMPLKIRTVYALLEVVRMGELDDENQGAIQRTCLQVYPRLVNYGGKADHIIDINSEHGHTLPEDADLKMQEQYKMMYSNDVDPRGMIERLQKLKESDDAGDQDLFASMIHGLFDEYNCFGEYPLEALATTAVLFGGIIAFGVLSSNITLGVALYMVLDAVQEHSPDDSMYKFGLQAALHFIDRLEEWPAFCNRLVAIPQLRGTEVYSRAEEVIRKQPHPDLGDGMDSAVENSLALTNGHVDDFASEPLYPPFQSLHVDPPYRSDLYEEPSEETSEKVTFVLNNVSKRNLKEKFKDLEEALEERHHQWFASYLVEDLVKSQPNFQALYMQVLNMFNQKWLWAEVLRETYHSLARLLNSDSTLTNATDRAYLKNLAGWLGLLTLARNRPILHRNLSFKDFLIEAHQTQRLPVAIPFTCKVLAQAKDSKVFKPPQPWLMELIGLLMELYHFAELKLNLKFEIEVMLKDLNLDIKEIEALNIFRTLNMHREEEILQQQYAADGMEGFGDMHLISLSKRPQNERFSSQDVLKSLPDLAEMLNYPPSSGSISQQQLKTIFLEAAQRAITEIIAPVVERSVTIAAISTSQLIEKDFAMEVNPETLQKSAHNVVKALSGSLALVTCKEPLRMSISNNIRILASQTLHEPLPEGSILMFVNDNLDTVCKLVEDAAESQSKAEIDAQIEEAVARRRTHLEQRSGEQFNYPAVSRWAFFIPEPYRQEPGGLNGAQLAIYEDFGRQRGLPSIQHGSNASQDTRQIQDVIGDSFLPNLPTPAEDPAIPRQSAGQPPRMPMQTPNQVNGYIDSHNIADRVLDMLSDLQRASREAPEDHIQELGSNSPVREIFESLIRLIESHMQKDALAIHAGQRATVLMYTEAKSRLEIEVLVQFLNQLCSLSVSTSKQLIMYLLTLDDDRAFNPAVVVCLLKARLVDMHHIDVQTATAIMQERPLAIDFLGCLIDELIVNDHPRFLRADLILSIGALDQYIKTQENNESARQVRAKLDDASTYSNGVSTPAESDKKDQLEYLFEEWVRLQRPDAHERYLASFIWQLNTRGIVATTDSTSEFLRCCCDMSIVAYEEQEASYYGTVDTAYIQVDAFARLLVSLVAYQSNGEGAVQSSQARYFERLLTVVVLVFNDQYNKRGEHFGARVFFRLFSSILCELNAYRTHFGESYVDMFVVYGKFINFLNPRHFPGFSFSWLTLMSHRMFLSVVLRSAEQKVSSVDSDPSLQPLNNQQGWDVYVPLLQSLFAYLGDLLHSSHIESSASMLDFYRGAIRVMLLLTHDAPEFFVENHWKLNAFVPDNAVQIYNLLNSAFPGSFQELPDPFSPNLKVNRLEQARQPPIVRGDIGAVIDDAGIKNVIDRVLDGKKEIKDEDIRAIISGLCTIEGPETLPINGMIVYLAIEGTKSNKAFDADSRASQLLMRTLASDAASPALQYHILGAAANQLRHPNSHTIYFSNTLLHLFATTPGKSDAIQQQIARILVERLMTARPHPWGLIVTMMELVKNPEYGLWELEWMKAAPEVERMFYQLSAQGSGMGGAVTSGVGAGAPGLGDGSAGSPASGATR